MQFCQSLYCLYTIYEPQHDKSNKMTCAPSEDSDQTGQPESDHLRCPLEEILGPKLPTERTVKWVPRPI